MQCPGCTYSDSKVVYTENNDLKNFIERRRECLRCSKRFTTHEEIRKPKKTQNQQNTVPFRQIK